MPSPPFPTDLKEIRAWLEREGSSRLPGHMGLEIVDLEPGRCEMRVDVRRHHLAPNGYLHAATIVALADTAAGFGCVASLPDGASGFTTIELKSNHLGTVLEGGIRTEASLLHGGRTTQVWDAAVMEDATDRRLAFFRCTQLIVYP